MMDYTSIFDSIPWEAVRNTVIQTFTIYWLVLLGLKVVGRRVFSEMGPQDLIVLLLVAESCDLGLADEQAGYWGTLASVITILVTGGIIERVKPLRQLLENNKVELYKNNQLLKPAMSKCLVEEDDLNKTAREYGLNSYQDFELLVLENDGTITGVVKPELRAPSAIKQTQGAL